MRLGRAGAPGVLPGTKAVEMCLRNQTTRVDVSSGRSVASSGWKGGQRVGARAGALSLKRGGRVDFQSPHQSQGPVHVWFWFVGVLFVSLF